MAVMIVSVLAGAIWMFVDNVEILMMAPVALPLTRALKLPVTPLVLMIGFSANFTGSAMVLGDLPPRMPYSVSAAAEFGDVFRLLATVLPITFRQAFGVKLGFIAMTGAVTRVLALELLGDRVKAPSFEEILSDLDGWAILFHIALFALVGGLEKVHLPDALAQWLRPVFAARLPVERNPLMYWATVPIVGFVEHDGYMLTFLYTVRGPQTEGVPPWPLWWMILWSGARGGNPPGAGAATLFAPLSICQRQ